MALETQSAKIENLIRLRWIAGAVMLLALFGAGMFFGIAVDRTSYALLIGYFASNGLLRSIRRITRATLTDWILLSVLIADTAFLTLLLNNNGGAHNPFSILFLAFASVGALVLSKRSLFILLAATLAALGFIYSEIPGEAHHHHAMGHGMDLSLPFHLRGMWLANSLGVLLICAWIFYLRRINERIAERHRATEALLTNLERVESMGRLAAQAAHQLNTPLGTLQLGLSEIADEQSPISPAEQKRWFVDMQHAVTQMGSIIQRLKPKSAVPGKGAPVSAADFVESWIDHWSQPRKVRVDFKSEGEECPISFAAADDLGNALTALLDNAFDALKDKPASAIELALQISADTLAVTVKDKGVGMDERTTRHAIEPLFTTKSKGTGLGLYLCHQTAQKYGGALTIESEPNKGTRVRLTFNRSKL